MATDRDPAHTSNAPIGFTPHEASAWSVGYEEGRRAALAAPPVEQQAAKRQYYYNNSKCEASDSHDGNCICWHDEGTGPCPQGRPGLTWRDMSTAQPAPQAGAAEVDTKWRTLCEAQAKLLEVQARRSTHPTEQPSQDATEEFVGYLCRAWGESDRPVAELVRDLESVGSFMVRQWLGEDDAQDYDGTPTLPRLMTEWHDHDWDNEWSADFEIGGVSVERLHCTVPAARAAQAQAQGEKGKA